MNIYSVFFSFKDSNYNNFVHNKSGFVKGESIEEVLRSIEELYPNARILNISYKGVLLI